MATGLKLGRRPDRRAFHRRSMLELQLDQQARRHHRYLPAVIASLLPDVGGVQHWRGAHRWRTAARYRQIAVRLPQREASGRGSRVESPAQWWLKRWAGWRSGTDWTRCADAAGRFELFVQWWYALASRIPVVIARGERCRRMGGGKQVDYALPCGGRSLRRTARSQTGAFSARGIFGQHMPISASPPVDRCLVEARSKPRFAEGILGNDFFNGVVRSGSGLPWRPHASAEIDRGDAGLASRSASVSWAADDSSVPQRSPRRANPS